jgi:rhomboid protease GluP
MGGAGGDWQRGNGERPFAPPEILPPLGENEPARPHDYTYRVQVPPPAPAPQPRRPLLRWKAAPATYALVAINVLVFALMSASGVSMTIPGAMDLVRWGAVSGQEVLAGEWWRLVTANFVHLGIIHLATNMWCLWNLGLLGEPLVGPVGLIAVYLLSGVAGNILSLAVNPDVIGAGASGAVFGIAGLLIVLLKNAHIPVPKAELQRLRRSVVYFAVLNFVIGFGSSAFQTSIRIDNMAHLGGFLMGLALGLPLAPRLMSGRQRYYRRQAIVFAMAFVLVVSAGFFVAAFRRDY